MAYQNQFQSHFPAINQAMSTPPQVGTSGAGTGNVTSISRGIGFGSVGPDLSGLSADELQQIQSNMSRLTYSLPAGGYRFNDEPGGANSYYSKYGGSNPAANSLASSTYGFLGSLPTRTYGTAALENLYRSTGMTPAQGPSLNSMLGGQWGGPYQVQSSRFTSTPRSGGSIGWG